MDIERTICEIESLEEMFDLPDIRPLSAADVLAANQRHDKKQANSPRFRSASATVSVAEASLRYSSWGQIES